MNKFLGHLKTVLKHKKNVAHYCFICGLYKQGLLHDMSKFSPTEFWESVKYWQGTRSPIDACKEDKGYSLAWFHHKGRNKHHWEYWMDDYEKGFIPKKMPYKYMLEMICDYLGAGRAYKGKDFSMDAEYAWWQTKKDKVKMHQDTFNAVDKILTDMNEKGIDAVLKDKNYMREFKMNY